MIFSLIYTMSWSHQCETSGKIYLLSVFDTPSSISLIFQGKNGKNILVYPFDIIGLPEKNIIRIYGRSNFEQDFFLGLAYRNRCLRSSKNLIHLQFDIILTSWSCLSILNHTAHVKWMNDTFYRYSFITLLI